MKLSGLAGVSSSGYPFSRSSRTGTMSDVRTTCDPTLYRRVSYLPRYSLTLVIVASLLFAACGHKKPVVQPPEIRTVEVKVPVPVKLTPPPELLAPVNPPLPVFISPFDPQATSALTAEGERLLRGMIEDLLARIKAWQAWAKEP